MRRVVWLNPLTYFELSLVPAPIGQSRSNYSDRIEFGGALLVTSAVCCLVYAYGGRLLAHMVESQRDARVFDFASGLILTVISASLATSMVSGSI